MPNGTYTLIASNTLTGTAATVTFSNIPQTYTDLIIRFSARINVGSNDWTVQPNGLSSNGSSTMVYYDGSGASAVATSTRNTSLLMGKVGGTATTALTYGSFEVYIPNYTSLTNKPMSAISVMENNGAVFAYIFSTAGLFTGTTPLTSIDIRGGGSLFLSESSFFLYGVKNS